MISVIRCNNSLWLHCVSQFLQVAYLWLAATILPFGDTGWIQMLGMRLHMGGRTNRSVNGRLRGWMEGWREWKDGVDWLVDVLMNAWITRNGWVHGWDEWMDGVGEWMCGWVYGEMVEWIDEWMHGWLNVCVGCLLVADLLGLWRGVKSRKPIGRGPLAWLNLP